jgi:putative restriction endonuclease
MTIGVIDGINVGSIWSLKSQMRECGIHRNQRGGIAGKGKEGAESVALTGGYIDDEDYGDEIIYTGSGGKLEGSKVHTFDQQFTRYNLSLVTSCNNGTPIRLIRGSNHDSIYSPKAGYRYDGLFKVEDYWTELGRDGFKICRFRLTKTLDEPVKEKLQDSTKKTVKRAETIIQRIVRDTVLGLKIKKLYDYRCQICGTKLQLNEGNYAEAAHIKPLGKPHNGPDSEENILCLCPNDHVLFDRVAISINDDLTIFPTGTFLKVSPRHKINLDYVRYHRETFVNSS